MFMLRRVDQKSTYFNEMSNLEIEYLRDLIISEFKNSCTKFLK